MHDIVVMAMVDTFQNLLDAVRRVGFAVVFARHNVLEQFAACDEVEDEIVESLLLNRVVQTNYKNSERMMG